MSLFRYILTDDFTICLNKKTGEYLIIERGKLVTKGINEALIKDDYLSNGYIEMECTGRTFVQYLSIMPFDASIMIQSPSVYKWSDLYTDSNMDDSVSEIFLQCTLRDFAEELPNGYRYVLSDNKVIGMSLSKNARIYTQEYDLEIEDGEMSLAGLGVYNTHYDSIVCVNLDTGESCYRGATIGVGRYRMRVLETNQQQGFLSIRTSNVVFTVTNIVTKTNLNQFTIFSSKPSVITEGIYGVSTKATGKFVYIERTPILKETPSGKPLYDGQLLITETDAYIGVGSVFKKITQ